MNKTYERPDTVINLRTVIWNLLSQWKALLIFSLIFALVVTGAKYAKDNKEYNASVDGTKDNSFASLSVDDSINSILSDLPSDEVQTINYLIQEQNLINTQKEYLDQSLYLSDPANQRTLTLKYYIKGSDVYEMQVLADAYGTCLRRKKNIETLHKVVAPDSDIKFVYEIFSPWSGAIADSNVEGIVYTTDIYLSDDVDSEAVEEAVNKMIDDAHEEVSNIVGDHSITFVNREETYKYNSGAVDRRVAINNSINGLQNNINAMKGTLSEESQAAFETICLILSGVDPAEAMIMSESDAIESESEEDLTAPAPSIKYAVLGFILGAILYAGIYLVLIILRGRVQSGEDLEVYSGSRLLGDINYKGKYKGIQALFHSNLVDKLRYGKKGDLATQTSRTAATIASVCDHTSVKDITLLRMSGSDGTAGKISEDIITALKAKGLAPTVIDFTEEIEENVLLPVKNAIFLAGKDNKVSDVCRLTELCQDYDIRQLGNVFIGQY